MKAKESSHYRRPAEKRDRGFSVQEWIRDHMALSPKKGSLRRLSARLNLRLR